MCCEHSFVYTSWSRVCVMCGVESRTLDMDTYNVYSAPLQKGYDRKLRFKVKVQKLLGFHNGPKHTDPIWKYLEQHKSMKNPDEVRRVIRGSRLVFKHYDCVKLFCDVFTPFRVVVNNPTMLRKTLQSKFEDIYSRWSLQGHNASFFSYDWLLRYFLTEVYPPLLVYQKPKTCKNRDAKYLAKLLELGQLNCCNQTMCTKL